MTGWILAAYEEHGAAIVAGQITVRQLAAAIGKSRSSAHRLYRYAKEAGAPETGGPVETTTSGHTATVTSKDARITTLGQLIAAAEIDLTRWRVAKWLANHWRSGSQPCWQVKAWLEKRQLADVRPAKPIAIRQRTKPPRNSEPQAIALFIPDTQHGFTWTGGQKHRRLEPMHDRRAIDAAWLLAEAIQPAVIVLLGDHLDLCEWGNYPRPPEHRQTTEPAVWELHWQLAQLRTACPSARIVMCEGNHEIRIRKALDAGMEAARHLRPADDPCGPELLSIPRLLALESLDIEYIGPYGANFWLWDQIQITHGQTVRGGGGKTAAALLSAGVTHHQVCGHIHRLEVCSRTVPGPGPSGHGTARTITAMSPGCLARLDGSVPGSKNPPDWQQGVGLAYLDDSENVHMTAIPIHDGRLIYASVAIQGADRSDEIAEDIGYPQIAHV